MVIIVMPRPKLLFLSGSYYPKKCGVSHYTQILENKLSRMGFEIVHLTTVAASQISADPSVKGVVKDWKNRDIMTLAQAVLKEKPNILHIQHSAASFHFRRAIFFLPLLLRLVKGHPRIITTVHEYGSWKWEPSLVPVNFLNFLADWGERKGLFDREDFFLLTNSNYLITTSSNTTQLICDRLPQLRTRTEEVVLGSNLEVVRIGKSLARKRVREELELAPETTIIVSFGFIHPVKGLETMIQAFKKIHALYPQTRLVLIGGVESVSLPGEKAQNYLHQLKQLIKDLGLQNKVIFTDHLPGDKVSVYLQGSDIGVLSSNLGINLKSGSLIAMLSHRLPVVITRHNPPESILEKQEIALVVERKSELELFKALQRLFENKNVAEQYIQNGAVFSRRFSWDTVLQKHLQIYEKVINQAPSVSL